MSVLARLALRAIGVAGPVRPRIGGLFERGAPGAAMDEGVDAVASALPATLVTPSVVVAVAQGESPGSAPVPPTIYPASAISDAGHEPRATTLATMLATAGPLSRPRPGIPSPPRQRARPGEEIGASLAAPARPAWTPDEPRAPGVADAPVGAKPVTETQAYRPLLPEFFATRGPAPPVELRAESASRDQTALHISIGRIEVRGGPERQRPAPIPRPGPRLMSLEDYLAKGRRR